MLLAEIWNWLNNSVHHMVNDAGLASGHVPLNSQMVRSFGKSLSFGTATSGLCMVRVHTLQPPKNLGNFLFFAWINLNFGCKIYFEKIRAQNQNRCYGAGN